MHGCAVVVKSLDAVLTSRDGEQPNRLCPLCRQEATAVAAEGDVLICLEGTGEVVCLDCAMEHDPELAGWLLGSTVARA
jgi:hypothetical protein